MQIFTMNTELCVLGEQLESVAEFEMFVLSEQAIIHMAFSYCSLSRGMREEGQ